MGKSRFFYGWVIVAVVFVCLALAYAVWYSFSLFFVAMLTEFGWSRAGTALVGAMFMITYGLTSPLAGAAVDRLGPRVVVPVGALILAVGLLASSRVSEPWHLYVYYGFITAIGVNLVGTMVNFVVLANWFSRRRGTATGIAASGIGVGTFVLAPALQYVINLAGWRMAYLVLAGIVIAVIPALALTFHRHRPEDMGLLPDGGPAKIKALATERSRPAVRIVDRAWAERAWTARSAAATRRFWLLALTLLFGALAHQSVMVHQVAYLADHGLDPMLGASVVGLVGICGSVGKVFWGWVSDRIGREGTYSLGMGCVIVGVLILSSIADTSQAWHLYAYAAVFGIGYGVSAPLNPAMVADIFQGKKLGSIYGMVYIGSGVGAAVGPWVSGLLFDLSQSYHLAFVMAGCAAVLSAAALWLAAPRKVREVPGIASRRHVIGQTAATTD